MRPGIAVQLLRKEIRVVVTDNNGLDVELIAPKHGAKYSPNLYRWLKKKSSNHRAWTSRLFRDSDGELWIGIYDAPNRELMGARLMAVLCHGSQQETAAWQKIEAVEIVGFWDRYVQDGRCAIDEAHEMNFKADDNRWSVQGDKRSCLWCGKAQQVMKRWTETVVREEWATA